MSKYEPRMQPGLQALIRNHSQKSLEVCKQLLAQMSMQKKVILRRRGMVKSEANPPEALPGSGHPAWLRSRCSFPGEVANCV